MREFSAVFSRIHRLKLTDRHRKSADFEFF